MREDRSASGAALELDAVLTWAEDLRARNDALSAENAKLRAASARADLRAVAIGLLAAIAFGAAGEVTLRCMAARAGHAAPSGGAAMPRR